MASRDLSPTGQRQAETVAPRFTLDASGVVFVPIKAPLRGVAKGYEWSDLTPFAQGYVEAMLREPALQMQTLDGPVPALAFRHLAPATLSRIIGDCERYCDETDALIGDRLGGGLLWRQRLRGEVADFPALTVSLGEDGLIYLREAGQ